MDITNNQKVAILMTDGVEQVEFTQPVHALQKANIKYDVISPKNEIKAWKSTDWGETYQADVSLDNANPNHYHALVLPGGVMNPDNLRSNTKAVKFVQAMFETGKPVAAICHGPQLLIETNMLKGRRLTSYPAIKTDLINAGADWVDEAVVVTNGLVTSRTPDDLDAFCAKMIEEINEGRHRRRSADKTTENVNTAEPMLV